MKKMYFVYGLRPNGNVIGGQKRVTDEEHLEKCIKCLKDELGINTVHVNEADFCFNGYLMQGIYLGKR